MSDIFITNRGLTRGNITTVIWQKVKYMYNKYITDPEYHTS
jgi:hypothetical protein